MCSIGAVSVRHGWWMIACEGPYDDRTFFDGDMAPNGHRRFVRKTALMMSRCDVIVVEGPQSGR